MNFECTAIIPECVESTPFDDDKDFIVLMRRYARIIAEEYGNVTSDDLRALAYELNIKPYSQSIWGAIFKGKEWKLIGEKSSSYIPNKHRKIKIWSLNK